MYKERHFYRNSSAERQDKGQKTQDGQHLKKLLFQVAWQPFPFVPVAQGMFRLVEQIREGLEMYCVCTSSNALGYGAKEKMKFYSLRSWSRKE